MAHIVNFELKLKLEHQFNTWHENNANMTPAKHVAIRVSDVPIRSCVLSPIKPAKVMTCAILAQNMKIITPMH